MISDAWRGGLIGISETKRDALKEDDPTLSRRLIKDFERKLAKIWYPFRLPFSVSHLPNVQNY
jgi:hypothetical protein